MGILEKLEFRKNPFPRSKTQEWAQEWGSKRILGWEKKGIGIQNLGKIPCLGAKPGNGVQGKLWDGDWVGI